MSEPKKQQPIVTIITGAGTGIGRAAAQRMAKHGPVVLVGRRPEPLQETGSTLGEQGIDWMMIPADIADPEDRCQIIDETLRVFGRISNLVNNAAIGTCASLGDLSEEQIRELIEINITAPVLLTRLALPHIAKQRGCIVSVGSRAATDPFPGLGIYGCTKAGLGGLARAITNEYGEQGVRAYTVHPGATETAMLRSIVSAEDLPQDQVLVPDDVAEPIEGFLLNNRAEPSGASIIVAKD